MKKILLLNFSKKKDYSLKSKLEEMGYSVSSLSISDIISPSNISVKKTDIIFYSYDGMEFDNFSNSVLNSLNVAHFVFVVNKCSMALFRNVSQFANSWYLKEPFEKSELDFTIRMVSSISSMKINKDEQKMFSSSVNDSAFFENTDFSIPYTGRIDYDHSTKEIYETDALLAIQRKVLDITYNHAPTLILIFDQSLRVEKINRICVKTLGQKSADNLGFAVGDVFSCVNSYKGEGCGTNDKCTTCSALNIVAETFITGVDCHKVAGSMNILDNGIVSSHDFLISTAYVGLADDKKVILYLDDITESKKAERTLKENEERIQSLYDNMPGGTIIIGKDYVIEDVNQRTCEITGYKKEELVGQLCDIICPKGSLSKKCPIWVDGLDGFQGMDTAVKCKNGSKTPILKNTKKIFIEGNQYILENFQDISERKESEEAILNAKITAEEANRTKSEFLATMSHELRTPLNAVIGYSDLLLEDTFGEPNAQQRRSLEHISNSGKHLLNLINDILDISKVESGKMELNYEEFRIKDIFANVLNIVSPLARKKNIEVEISIASENLSLNADRIRFKQILFNLASNAVKFTPEGGHVMLEAHEKDGKGVFSVSDTGIGISSENIGKLFLPFQQIDSTISRMHNGTGLGLSLVKKFIEMHGGDISVESETDKGSQFTFIIPLDVATH